MREQLSQLKVTPLIGAVAANADNTRIWVDRANYEALSILLSIGIGGITFDSTNKVEFKLYESDASDGTGATLVAEADLIGASGAGSTGILKSLVAAHAAAASYLYGYRGNKRYIGLLADFSGTHGTATPISATAIMGKPRNSPTS